MVESCSKKVAASSVWASVNTFSAVSGDFAKAAEINSPPNTYNTMKSKIDGDLLKFLLFSLPALHGQLADLPNRREFLSIPPLHGIILAIFKNAKNGRKKTGNLFLISCLGVPFYVAAVIQFFDYNSTNWILTL